jgi:inhibitor of cysteine peptidase
MKTYGRTLWALTLAIVLLAAACAPTQEPESTPSEGEVVRGLARVESIEILILESFPVQVQVRAQGNLPDGCTTIDETLQERSGNTFVVKVTTARPKGALCTEALVPFETTIALDVLGLEAGTYTVTVNGVGGTFTLDVDNVAPEG